MEGTRPGPRVTPSAERNSPEPGSPQPVGQPAGMPDWPSPAMVTFVTTEHFALQGARSATISESTGRASIFLGAVSGGLIALGLVATAAETGVAFYMFGLIL